eukprot:PhF_6_TR4256/c0_g1_i1/m.5754
MFVKCFALKDAFNRQSFLKLCLHTADWEGAMKYIAPSLQHNATSSDKSAVLDPVVQKELDLCCATCLHAGVLDPVPSLLSKGAKVKSHHMGELLRYQCSQQDGGGCWQDAIHTLRIAQSWGDAVPIVPEDNYVEILNMLEDVGNWETAIAVGMSSMEARNSPTVSATLVAILEKMKLEEARRQVISALPKTTVDTFADAYSLLIATWSAQKKKR